MQADSRQDFRRILLNTTKHLRLARTRDLSHPLKKTHNKVHGISFSPILRSRLAEYNEASQISAN